MIVVYPHYRLGAFGWLALPALDEETADGMSSGNYGFLDVIQSLRWVKENIAAFGGDPDAVTIGGASSGGQLVCIALTAPLEEKLFHQAIIQSGECAPSSSADRGSTQPAARAFMVTHQQELLSGIPFAVQLGCTAPETFATCLRAVSASALLAGGLTPHPNVGGALMPAFFFDAIRSRHIAKVPVLLGVSHDELRSFPLPTTGFPGTVDAGPRCSG
jgi:para-nitrobenzyl esterase